jgi:orotate phosphoribosyltransferase
MSLPHLEKITSATGLSELEAIGALLQNTHVVYTSGKHGSAYINKDALYPHTALISQLCREIAQKFIDKDVEVVLAPVVGGVILSQWVAHHLTEISGKEVLAVYAEKKDGGGFVLKRGYDQLVKDRRVLLVEDVLNTGGSIAQVIEAALPLLDTGKIVGLGALANRGGVTSAQVHGVSPIFALWELNLEAWDASKCPLCQQGIPINTRVGKGHKS